MHPECKRLTSLLPTGFELTCHMKFTDVECLGNNLMSFCEWNERAHREELIDEVLVMFPKYSAADIADVIHHIPMYVNAHYAIMKAICSPNGFEVAGYNIPHVKPMPTVMNDLEPIDMESVKGGSATTIAIPSLGDEFEVKAGENGVDSAGYHIGDQKPAVVKSEAAIANIDQNNTDSTAPITIPNLWDVFEDGINHSGSDSTGFHFLDNESTTEKCSTALSNLDSNYDDAVSRVRNPGVGDNFDCQKIQDGIVDFQREVSCSEWRGVTGHKEVIGELLMYNEGNPRPGTSWESDDDLVIMSWTNMSNPQPSTSRAGNIVPKNKRKINEQNKSHNGPQIKRTSSAISGYFQEPIVIPDACESDSSSTQCNFQKNSYSETVDIQDERNCAVDQKLLNTLAELFPNCDRDYLMSLCEGKDYDPLWVDSITETLLTQDYPEKTRENPIDFDSQLDIMMSVLPDADPEYLSAELAKMSNADELKVFMSRVLEMRNYPKLEDVQRTKKVYAQARQYTTDFNPEEFLRTIPDPETYFTSEAFRAAEVIHNTPAYSHMYSFLRNHFNVITVKRIGYTLARSTNLIEAVARLERCKKRREELVSYKRKRVARHHCTDIPLLQLFAYIENKELILHTRETLKEEAENRRQQAIANEEVKTCGCCFDEEVMPEDIFQCASGCLSCRDCIRRGTEIHFAENNVQFPCLSNCGEHISLDTLQQCVPPKMFCKIAKRQQLEEVKAAGIEDLEICPFCDFAAIPAVDDKIFKCFNPECMKETCRLCKEPSHIPLHCDELEKDSDVKQRVFIENQMTEALMRKCWQCDLKFIKSEGCNKICCTCGATMCYICNKADVDYKHFNGQGGTDFYKCPLYSNTDLLHEENAIKGGLEAKKQLGISELKVDPLADADVRIKKAKKGYRKRPGE